MTSPGADSGDGLALEHNCGVDCHRHRTEIEGVAAVAVTQLTVTVVSPAVDLPVGHRTRVTSPGADSGDGLPLEHTCVFDCHRHQTHAAASGTQLPTEVVSPAVGLPTGHRTRVTSPGADGGDGLPLEHSCGVHRHRHRPVGCGAVTQLATFVVPPAVGLPTGHRTRVLSSNADGGDGLPLKHSCGIDRHRHRTVVEGAVTQLAISHGTPRRSLRARDVHRQVSHPLPSHRRIFDLGARETVLRHRRPLNRCSFGGGPRGGQHTSTEPQRRDHRNAPTETN